MLEIIYFAIGLEICGTVCLIWLWMLTVLILLKHI